MSNSPGIDYGNGKANIDDATGIRFGVISCNSFSCDAQNDFEPDYGRPDSFECPDCGESLSVTNKEWGDSVECKDCDESYDIDLPDCVESCGWTYEKDRYVITDCLDNDAMIIKSPFYTYAQFCSPCVPGAGNLDNTLPWCEGMDPDWKRLKVSALLWRRLAIGNFYPKVFCLGHDWFDEGVAPYPVFNVDTLETVLPTR
jgi:hypothetical protein